MCIRDSVGVFLSGAEGGLFFLYGLTFFFVHTVHVLSGYWVKYIKKLRKEQLFSGKTPVS